MKMIRVEQSSTPFGMLNVTLPMQNERMKKPVTYSAMQKPRIKH